MRHAVLLNLFFLTTLGATSIAQGKESGRALFDFTDGNPDQWQIVNDGVMGGRSTSKVEMIDENQMRFVGNLSLANNGGFASVRSKPKPLGLNTGDAITVRVKGDGRKYTFNLYVPTQRVAFSYQADFETKANEWTEITVPLKRFQATSFGRAVTNQPLDPSQVNSVGILLGDKKAGAFELVVDWIKVKSNN